MLLRLLCAVLMIGVLAGTARAATLFSEDFEVADPASLTARGWEVGNNFDRDGSPVLAIVPAPSGRSGNVLRMQYQGLHQNPDGSWDDAHNAKITKAFTDAPDVYERYYVRYDALNPAQASGFGGNSKQHYHNVSELPNIVTVFSNGFPNLMAGNQSNVMHTCPNGSTDVTCNLPPNTGYNPAFTYGVWFCVEEHLGQGVYQMWVNEQLTLNYTGILSPANWHVLQIYRQGADNQYRYEDDLVISTTRVGCGSAPPTDTVPPGQTVGLAIAGTSTSNVLTWTSSTATDLQDYLVQRCTPTGGCTPSTTVGTVTAPTFTDAGLTPGVLYRYRVIARDGSGNQGTASAIAERTTTAASGLPTVTAFSTSGTGGTITYTGSPAYYRIVMGDDTGQSEIVLDAASVPSGALTFRWPPNIKWACAHAQDGSHTEDPVGYTCAGVTPLSATSLLGVHPTNPIWFADATGKATYLAGTSGGSFTFPNYNRSVLQNFTNRAPTDSFRRANSADLGASWDGGYGADLTFNIVNDAVRCNTVLTAACAETSTAVTLDADQHAQVTIRNWATTPEERIVQIYLRSAAAPTKTRYVFGVFTGQGSTAVQIERDVAGVNTVLKTGTLPVPKSGDIVRASVVGTTLTLRVNGVVVLQVDDGTIASGTRAGLMIYNAGTSADEVELIDWYAWSNSSADPTVNDTATAFQTAANLGLSYLRLWVDAETPTAGETAWYTAGEDPRIPLAQMPWRQVGVRTTNTPGKYVMVGIYDLAQWNEPWFAQVRQRVQDARAKGIAVSVMMFSSWFKSQVTYEAFANVFASGNNVNLAACDVNANGRCEENLTTSNTAVLAYQMAYVKKMVRTLGDLENVIWELANEPTAASLTWQDTIADTIVAEETANGFSHHLIYQTPTIAPAATSNAYLTGNTRVQVISPSCFTGTNFDTNPPAADGTKLLLYDSDHTGESDMCGTWASGTPWKLFTRGYHAVSLNERESAPTQALLLAQLGQTVSYSRKIDLANAYPETGTTYFSTGYGLFTGSSSTTANCSEYVMYMPSDGSSSIDLSACSGGSTFDVEYLNVTSGAVSSGGTVAGGASRSFNPAGSDPMVVYLKLNIVTDTTPPVIQSCVLTPTGVLPSTATSVLVSCITNETATLKYDSTAGTAYASMATTFSTTNATTHSTTISGLSAGTSYTRYIRATDGTNPTVNDFPISFSVAAAADLTAPADVTGLTGVSSASDSIQWTWAAVADGDLRDYTLEIAVGAAPFTFATTTVTTTATHYTQTGLTVGDIRTARVRANDTAANPSLNWSSPVTVTTTPIESVSGLTATAYPTSIVLSYTSPSASGLTLVLERCTGAACSSGFTPISGGPSIGFLDASSVSAGTTYGYRAKFSNGQTVSPSWSSTVYITTPTTSGSSRQLTRPRTTVPYGQPRLPRN